MVSRRCRAMVSKTPQRLHTGVKSVQNRIQGDVGIVAGTFRDIASTAIIGLLLVLAVLLWQSAGGSCT